MPLKIKVTKLLEPELQWLDQVPPVGAIVAVRFDLGDDVYLYPGKVLSARAKDFKIQFYIDDEIRLIKLDNTWVCATRGSYEDYEAAKALAAGQARPAKRARSTRSTK